MNAWQTEYPRPQLRRESFYSLCGERWTLDGQPITVPFPPQSPASGYAGSVGDKLHYEVTFTLPEGFAAASRRVLLHLGAVDQLAGVTLNGQHLAYHEGGYLPFSVDVTDALAKGSNLLAVDALDRLDRDLPHGKQSKTPGGMWYTPVSGIWQPVWLEAVPEKHIRRLRITPDLTGIDLLVDSDAPRCEAVIRFGETVIVRETWVLNGRPRRIELPEEHRHLWTPDAPNLYDLTVTAGLDRVESYFALRTVEIVPDAAGVQRVCLNGKPVFLSGVLDQGYFMEGIFLPAEPAEYERDVLRMKALGFNMLRKHVKLEPECFYAACDRLGMLVLQDMVSSGPYSWLMDTALPTLGVKYTPHLPLSRRCRNFFEQHAKATVQHLYNHPCVIAYTIFNEGWGQFDGERLYYLLRGLDPTRFYDVASGWFTPRETDVDSRHVYFRNRRLYPGKRPMLLSECGGFARAVEGHLFKPDANYGYGKAATEEQLTAAITLLYGEMVDTAIAEGLCGAVYTQLSDVEEEINGLYTYDRQVCKVDAERMRLMMQEAQELLDKAVR